MPSITVVAVNQIKYTIDKANMIMYSTASRLLIERRENGSLDRQRRIGYVIALNDYARNAIVMI